MLCGGTYQSNTYLIVTAFTVSESLIEVAYLSEYQMNGEWDYTHCQIRESNDYMIMYRKCNSGVTCASSI